MFSILSRVFLLSTILLCGCSKKEQPQSEQATPSAPKTASTNPLSTEGEFPGITVTVQEIRRADKTVTLKFVMSNQSQKDFSPGYNFGEGGPSVADFDTVAGTHLIDSTNKNYPVLRDNDRKCLCSRSIGGIHAGSQVDLWAKFDAPPSEIEKVSVVVPHFPPIDDVPVTQTAGETK